MAYSVTSLPTSLLSRYWSIQSLLAYSVTTTHYPNQLLLAYSVATTH